MSHVASICELPGGGLAAAWYTGSHEGAPDVAICFSARAPAEAKWSPPRPIMTREVAERDLNRHIKKVGNAVLFSNDAGHLWLLYVSVSIGGWSGSSINLTESADLGRSWSPSRRLTLSPFFNLGELVRNQPVALSDATWVVPIYQELLGRVPELLWLGESVDGPRTAKTRIDGGRSGFQPALAILSPTSALAFLRDFSAHRRISTARTDDAARAWSIPRELNLPNPDSGLTSLRLTDGRIVLIFNDSKTARNNLRLAVSEDEGQTWTRCATLAEEDTTGVAYPYALQTRDGQIHVVYTWRMGGIKHVVFNESWLSARQRVAFK
jgi:predicted neuraminidase